MGGIGLLLLLAGGLLLWAGFNGMSVVTLVRNSLQHKKLSYNPGSGLLAPLELLLSYEAIKITAPAAIGAAKSGLFGGGGGGGSGEASPPPELPPVEGVG